MTTDEALAAVRKAVAHFPALSDLHERDRIGIGDGITYANPLMEWDVFEYILAALRAIAPDGPLVAVPRQPTQAMVDVGTEARWRSAVRDADNVREIYQAMIEEASKP